MICSITENRQGEPMHAACSDLTVMNVRAGHWLPLERKAELIQAIRTWLQSKNLGWRNTSRPSSVQPAVIATQNHLRVKWSPAFS